MEENFENQASQLRAARLRAKERQLAREKAEAEAMAALQIDPDALAKEAAACRTFDQLQEQELPESAEPWADLPNGYGDAEQSGAVQSDLAADYFDASGMAENAEPEVSETPESDCSSAEAILQVSVGDENEEALACDEEGEIPDGDEEAPRNEDVAEPEKKSRPIMGFFRWFALLFSALSFACFLWGRKDPEVADFFVKKIQTPVSQWQNALFGRVKISVAEWVLPAFFLGVLIAFIIWLVRMICRKHRVRRLFAGLISLVLGACFLFSCFFWAGGHALNRTPVARVKTYGEAELQTLYEASATWANRLSNKVVFAEGETDAKVLERLFDHSASAMKNLAKTDSYLLDGDFSVPKPMILSEAMCKTGFTGLYFPFTGEANINALAPRYSMPLTVCHEVAHQRGVQREDEATFYALKACLLSGEDALAYSALLRILSRSESELAQYTEVQRLENEQVLAVWKAEREFWEKYESSLMTATSDLNDRYLTASGQDGERSYSAFIAMLLADEDVMAALNQAKAQEVTEE